ncbi:hypothetical protein BMS3Abin04_01792 [bacterium BMS3Abin04]|nr:hypothetical protein BMS3Abin04_01792 [bacterium BMS3Abin04]
MIERLTTFVKVSVVESNWLIERLAEWEKNDGLN